MAYPLEGNLLEVCDCEVLCPCWIGEDPDNGTCQGTMAWNVESGTIDGTDVFRLDLGRCGSHSRKNALQGNRKAAVFVDDRSTKQQEEALLNAWSGQ